MAEERKQIRLVGYRRLLGYVGRWLLPHLRIYGIVAAAAEGYFIAFIRQFN